jgi:mono/diheme cytochrome c family protein
VNRRAILLLAALLLAGAGWMLLRTNSAQVAQGTGLPLVEVRVPELSAVAQRGSEAFVQHCASCHGENAAGRDGAGPPLVHRIYEPNHHGDMAFLLAVRTGVRAHHWNFGDMPAVEGVGEDEIEAIVAYVRELQRANGIF